MRKLLTIMAFLPLFAFGQNLQDSFTVNGKRWLALVKLPSGYSGNENNYPTIIFLHGIGETYNSSKTIAENYALIRRNGPSRHIHNGSWNGTVTVSGVTHTPIIVSLQAASTWPSPCTMEAAINAVKGKYRVGTVYLLGLSMGGKAVSEYAKMFPQKVAALVTVVSAAPNTKYSCNGTSLTGGYADFVRLGAQGVRFYGFKQQLDNVVNPDYASIVNYINTAAGATIAGWKLTNFGTGGHACCFDAFFNPSAKFEMLGATQNIYQFLLRTTPPSQAEIDEPETPAPPGPPGECYFVRF